MDGLYVGVRTDPSWDRTALVDPDGALVLNAEDPVVAAEVQEEIRSINTDATNLALQVALLVPILAGLAGLFSFLINRAGVPVAVGEWLVQTIETGAGFLLAVNTFLFVLGMFLDWVGIALLTIPIFIPIVRELEFDPVWFGVLFALIVDTAISGAPPAHATFRRNWKAWRSARAWPTAGTWC